MRWLAALCLLATPAVADDMRQSGQDAYFVQVERANVRLCPAQSCPSTNKLQRGQAVDLYEVKQGWARISKYYDSSAERAEFPEITSETVAQWVRADLLTNTKPVEKRFAPDPNLNDERITGIPDHPAYDLSDRDVTILRKFAIKLLKSGECSEIDDGDKSLSKPGRYYVHCRGEASNRFFSQEHVADN